MNAASSTQGGAGFRGELLPARPQHHEIAQPTAHRPARAASAYDLFQRLADLGVNQALDSSNEKERRLCDVPSRVNDDVEMKSAGGLSSRRSCRRVTPRPGT